MNMHDAAPIGVSDSDSSLGLAMVGQSILSLVVVVAVILLIGYLIKVCTNGSTRSKRHAKVVSSTMVGSKERVVIVEVENTWLVLGVGNGNVNKLHQLPKPVAEPDDLPVALSGTFGERFAQAIKSKLK
jgi:flagellar protein FliO/FliZ